MMPGQVSSKTISDTLLNGLETISKVIATIQVTPSLINSIRALGNATILLKEAAEVSTQNLSGDVCKEIFAVCDVIEKSTQQLFASCELFEKGDEHHEEGKVLLKEGATNIAAKTRELIELQENGVHTDVCRAAQLCALSVKRLFLATGKMQELVEAAKSFAQDAFVLARVLQQKSETVDGAAWQQSLKDACTGVKVNSPALVNAAKKATLSKDEDREEARKQLRAAVQAMSSSIQTAIQAATPPRRVTDTPIPDQSQAGEKRTATIRNPRKGKEVLQKVATETLKRDISNDLEQCEAVPVESIVEEHTAIKKSVEDATVVADEPLLSPRRKGSVLKKGLDEVDALLKERDEIKEETKEAEEESSTPKTETEKKPEIVYTDASFMLEQLSKIEVAEQDGDTEAEGGERAEIADDVKENSPELWTCEAVAKWLLQEGYEETIANLFRENAVDGGALADLDREDLKEMGIDKVGVQRKLFKSIRKLMD